ncbi:MAG: hypothetical protein KGY99_06070 [Phycisphaerae bacterium]|nr:hypothetical protein [Phycisphaerae bacterium]
MTDTYEIYLGIGGPDAVDYGQPVAWRQGAGPVDVPIALSPGVRYVLAARAVSDAGILERNTHVLTTVEVNADGALLGAPPPRPEDVTADVLAAGDVRLAWSNRAALGLAEPDGFDVLSDGGTGTLDEDVPVATVDDVRPGQQEFAVELPAPTSPLRLAVRARAAGRVGPISRPAPVYVPPPAASVALL